MTKIIKYREVCTALRLAITEYTHAGRARLIHTLLWCGHTARHRDTETETDTDTKNLLINNHRTQ